jgi:surface protein
MQDILAWCRAQRRHWLAESLVIRLVRWLFPCVVACLVCTAGAARADMTLMMGGRLMVWNSSFKMTWAIADTNAVTIPTVNMAGYNGTINWGDGTATAAFTAWDDADFTHSYSGAGSYQITISGSFPRIYFNNAGHKLLITSVDNLGSVGWTSFAGAFYGCANLVSVAGDGADVSNVTSFTSAWNGCTVLTTLGDLSGWNVEKVETFYAAWNDCFALTTMGDLSGWDVAKVKTFHRAWYNCQQLTTLGDLSGWDVANVTSFLYAWYNCYVLTTLGDLSGWNVAKVETFAGAWRNCIALTNCGLVDIPATCTIAQYIYNECNVLTGDVSQVSFLGTSVCTHWGCQDSDLTYQSTGGFFTNAPSNINIEFHNCNLLAGNVDNILVDLDTSGATNGVVNLSGNAAPTIVGLTSKTNLETRTWTVTVAP